MAKLIWGEDGEAAVGSAEELDALLDRLTGEAESSEPFIVELVGDGGAALSMGIGRPLSVVNYVSASFDPPYFQSVGHAGNEDELVFLYRGEWSEFPPQSAVPTEHARDALRRFLETEMRPDSIAWGET